MEETSFAALEDPAALLKWYVEQGLDETIGEEAVDRLPCRRRAAAPSRATQRVVWRPPRPRRRHPSGQPRHRPPRRAPVPLESPQLVEDAREIARRCTTIAELEEAVRAFEGCALKRTAKNTVFADGVAARRSWSWAKHPAPTRIVSASRSWA